MKTNKTQKRICRMCDKPSKRLMVYKYKNNGKPLNPPWQICHECSRIRYKKYHKTKESKKVLKAAQSRMYLKHKEKWLVRLKTRYAIEKGLLKKPDRCEVCEKKVSGHKLQAHHEDYTKPLEVIFLCYSCHADADRERESRLSSITRSNI